MSNTQDSFAHQWEDIETHTEFSLAFLHGTLTADCCHQQHRILTLFDQPTEKVQKFLAVWQIHIEKSLQSDDYKFQLPVPKEEDNRQSSQALKDWASGFVYSIDKLAKVSDPLNIEFCEDIQSIANLTVVDDSTDEDTARDLAEIEEYCRMGAISVFTEMHKNTQ